MSKPKPLNPAVPVGSPIPGAPGRPRGLAADYQRRVPPWLSWVLRRFPFFQRHPHPMLAHFPIVYLLAATFFSVLFLATGEQAFDHTAFYCLVAGVLFVPPAILSGLFTHWLNFPGEAHRTVVIEKRLSAILLAVATGALIWRWFKPSALHDLSGANIIYLLLILALPPLVTATSYFGGMLTFPLEDEGRGGQGPKP